MRLYANDYPGHARQYGLLRNAFSYLCNDLDINYKNVKISRDESAAGSTYCAHIVGEYTLNFVLDTDVEVNKIQKIRAQVDIKYDGDSVSFQISDDITKYVDKDNYLERWAAHAIHKFNLEHNPLNLNVRFGETILRVYGSSDDPLLPLKEMRLLLDGMQQTKTDKILAYRFRHVDNFLRTYSYCFFVRDDYNPDFWVFFLNVGGLDSGGHSKSLQMAESIIASKTKIELRYVDIEYVRLRKFLSEHVHAFNFEEQNTLTFDLSILENFGQTFLELHSKFLERYKNKEYSEALRNLRVLVQMSMETVCKRNQIQIPAKPNIDTLCSRLIKNNVLDGVMKAWQCAFTSVTNLSAHKEFPSNDDLLNQNMEDRTKITILLGIHIINSLGYMTVEIEDPYEDSTHSKTTNTKSDSPNHTFYINNKQFRSHAAIGALKQIVEYLAEQDPAFLKKFSAHTIGRGHRRCIARNKIDLYPKSPHLQDRSHELKTAPGWWLPTCLSVKDIKKITAQIKEAAEPKIRNTMVGDIFNLNETKPSKLTSKSPLAKRSNLASDMHSALKVPESENAENEFKSSFMYDYKQ